MSFHRKNKRRKVVGASVQIRSKNAVSNGKKGVITQIDKSHYEGDHCRPVLVVFDEFKHIPNYRGNWWAYRELVLL